MYEVFCIKEGWKEMSFRVSSERTLMQLCYQYCPRFTFSYYILQILTSTVYFLLTDIDFQDSSFCIYYDYEEIFF